MKRAARFALGAAVVLLVSAAPQQDTYANIDDVARAYVRANVGGKFELAAYMRARLIFWESHSSP